MKKILLFAFALGTVTMFSQTLSYSDQAVLFSSNDNFGTARFTGMSGAFGALGGDISAVDINPAGLAVFNNTDFSTTLSYRNTEINSSFYNSSVRNKDDYFRFSQIGGVLALNNIGHSDLNKVVFGFNYSVIKDFNNNYLINGNSGIPTFVDDPFLNFDGDDTNNIYYTNVDNQYFTNYTSGINDKFTMSFGMQIKEIFYFGMAFNFQNINYFQTTNYEEYNNDGSGNTLDAFLYQELSTYGNGFSFGIGGIVKPIQNLRIGLSYQSPIWYNLSENSILYEDPTSGELFPGDLEIKVSNNPNEIYTEYGNRNYFDYSLSTPGKFTGSLAYVFGTHGLISFDYTYQDFTGINLSPSSIFIPENEDIRNGLTNTSIFKVGGEWRIMNISLRGGYRFEQSPYRNSLSDEDLKGYSLGLGIHLGVLKLDFAYDNSTYSSIYRIVENPTVNPAVLDINNNRFTSTLIFNF